MLQRLAFAATVVLACVAAAPATAVAIQVEQDDNQIRVDAGAITASINKKGYVSGIAAGTFLDRKTGAHDLGFGLHIMDFLLAPGWRDDAYERDAKLHGNLPKHFIELPQICTGAKVLDSQIIRGKDFVAVKLKFRYTRAAPGLKPGSLWEQTMVFQPGVRYVLSAERITSANDVDDLFYRLDMPGHIRHNGSNNFNQVYLSYLNKLIPAPAFDTDFGPDEKFLYQREAGHIPPRMIRAYQAKLQGKPGPWLAGMTLDPAEVAEAWCHQRGYVCMIQELHRKHVKAGESFGAAYVIGWFDDVPEMQKVYDQFKGATGLEVTEGGFRFVR